MICVGPIYFSTFAFVFIDLFYIITLPYIYIYVFVYDVYICWPVLTGGIAIKGAGVGVGTLPGLQGVGHGLQCKAEGQETLTVTYLS